MFKYTVVNKDENIIDIDLSVDANDTIFNGHFPEKKVTPGACQSQLIIDIICREFNVKTNELEIKNIKFHSPHLPENQEKLNLNIEKKEKRGKMSFKAVISDKNTIYTSIVGSFI